MVHIEKCDAKMIPQWVALRIALWPDEDPQIMAREAPAMPERPDMLVRVARDGDGHRQRRGASPVASDEAAAGRLERLIRRRGSP